MRRAAGLLLSLSAVVEGKTTAVLLHPHGPGAQSVLENAAAVFNAMPENSDANMVIEMGSWGMGGDIKANTSAHYAGTLEPNDIAVVTIGNTWAADFYGRGALRSIQSNLDGWRSRRKGGDVTRDFARNTDMDYMFPKNKDGDTPADALNEWYALPMDVGTRVMFYRVDWYRRYLGTHIAPDSLEEVMENSKVILARLDDDVVSDVWRVSNTKEVLWQPQVNGLKFYSDVACTQEVAVAEYLCGTSMEPTDRGASCTLPRTASCAEWGADGACQSGTAWVGARLAQPVRVGCATIDSPEDRHLGSSNVSVTINASAAASVTSVTDGDTVTYPELGFSVTSNDEDPIGFKIASVDAGSAAHAAKLRKGQIIKGTWDDAAGSWAGGGGPAALTALLTGGGDTTLLVEQWGGVTLSRYGNEPEFDADGAYQVGATKKWYVVDHQHTMWMHSRWGGEPYRMWRADPQKVVNKVAWGFPLTSTGGASNVMQEFQSFLFGKGSYYVGPGGSCPYRDAEFKAALQQYTDTYVQYGQDESGNPKSSTPGGRLNPYPDLNTYVWCDGDVADYPYQAYFNDASWECKAVSWYLASGKAVHVLGASWFDDFIAENGMGTTYGALDRATQVGVGPGPAGEQGRYSFMGGSGWAVPIYADEAKVDVAWRFVEYAFDPARNYLTDTIFAAGLLPGYDSVMVRYKATGRCAATCGNVTATLPFAVPLHYPRKGFFKMGRIEENATIQWMVQSVMTGVRSIDAATQEAEGWFINETTFDDPVPTPPPSPPDQTGLIAGVVVACVVALVGMIGGFFMYLKVTQEQRRVAAMTNSNNICAEMAHAVGHLDFNHESIHALEQLQNPNQIQAALRNILRNMKQFVPFLPANVVRAVRGEEDEEEEEPSEKGSKVVGSKRSTGGTSRRTGTVASRVTKHTKAHAVEALRKGLEKKSTSVSVISIRFHTQEQGRGLVASFNGFASAALEAVIREKGIVHRFVEDGIIGTWGAVNAIKGKGHMMKAAMLASKTSESGNIHCGCYYEKSECAPVGTERSQFYAVLGGVIEQADVFARAGCGTGARTICHRSLANEQKNFFATAAFFEFTDWRSKSVFSHVVLGEKVVKADDEWMYQLESAEKKEAAEKAAGEMSLEGILELYFKESNSAAAKEKCAQWCKGKPDDKFAAWFLGYLETADGPAKSMCVTSQNTLVAGTAKPAGAQSKVVHLA